MHPSRFGDRNPTRPFRVPGRHNRGERASGCSLDNDRVFAYSGGETDARRDSVNHGTWELHEGDCLEVMRRLPAESADAIVADPPYSSGGLHVADRQADPLRKYVATGTKRARSAAIPRDHAPPHQPGRLNDVRRRGQLAPVGKHTVATGSAPRCARLPRRPSPYHSARAVTRRWPGGWASGGATAAAHAPLEGMCSGPGGRENDRIGSPLRPGRKRPGHSVRPHGAPPRGSQRV